MFLTRRFYARDDLIRKRGKRRKHAHRENRITPLRGWVGTLHTYFLSEWVRNLNGEINSDERSSKIRFNIFVEHLTHKINNAQGV